MLMNGFQRYAMLYVTGVMKGSRDDFGRDRWWSRCSVNVKMVRDESSVKIKGVNVSLLILTC